MITFPKIKAAGYAIGKRLQGYHLLKNPAGTHQTEVNMIKTTLDEINKSGVRITVTRRISRIADESGNINIEKRNIITHRIYNFENKKFSKAKNTDLFIKNYNFSKIWERNLYSLNQLGRLHEHSMQEIGKVQKQMQEFNEKIKSKRQNFFKVLYQNLWSK